jgi:hypothetical protein
VSYTTDTSTPAPAPIARTVDTPAAVPATGADAASSYLDTFTAPQTADQIAEGKRKASQALIDSTNKVFDDQVAAAQQRGTERVNQNNAISVLSGLMGSTDAVRTDNTVKDANSKEVQAIQNQRAQALASIYQKISDDASTEAEQQKQDAFKSAQDIVTRRAQSQKEALANVQALAASGGISYEDFKSHPKNAQVYQYALNAAGGSDDALAGIFAASRPKDSLVGTPQRVGDHYVQAYQNPLTGKVSYDKVEVPGGIPDTYNQFQTIGNEKVGQRIYAIPDNWDGDTSKLKLVASTAGIGNGTGGTAGAAGYNGDFGATIDKATNLYASGSVAAQKTFKASIQGAVANGDYQSAYDFIKQATAKGLDGTNKTKFEDAAIDQQMLGLLNSRIKAYQDAGGDMNIVKAAALDAGKRIGVLTTDKPYAALGAELDAAFQQYRQNMTGAAFGAGESADYQKVRPSKSGSFDLNTATLQGALNYANDYVESTIASKVGQGGIYIKQYAEGASPAGGSSSAASDADPLGLGI